MASLNRTTYHSIMIRCFMKRQVVFACMVTMLIAWFSGCGYRFAGSGSYPAGVSRIFITMLDNRSAETGVESTFTNDLIHEFTRKRKESLAPDRTSADAILTGTIVRLSVENIARANVSTGVERRVTGTLNLQLASPDGRVHWASGDIVESQTYPVVVGDQTATDRNKSDAIDAVSQKAAVSAFNRLTDDF